MGERPFTMRFDDEAYAHLQAMSLLTGRSMADIVLEAIQTHVPGDTDIEALAAQRIEQIQDAAALLLRRTAA
jgi:predicted DNA-binding protein